MHNFSPPKIYSLGPASRLTPHGHPVILFQHSYRPFLSPKFIRHQKSDTKNQKSKQNWFKKKNIS